MKIGKRKSLSAVFAVWFPICLKTSFSGLRTAVLFVFLTYLPQASAATSSGITYHGRIIKPNGVPLEGANVQFRLQIRTPGNENCLLFEEIQSKDMRNGVRAPERARSA